MNIEHLIGKVHCMDCLELMRQMPDKCIDLVLTDPPYGLGFSYDSFNDTSDNLSELIKKIFPNLLRVSQRVVLTPGHTNLWKYPPANWIMAWVYGTTNSFNCWGFTSWQPILCYGKDVYLQKGLGARMDIIKDSHVPDKTIEHPCPKSINFISKLLDRCSLEGDIVFDPFMGSGTTGLTCEKLNRRWIGCDISERYCQIARERIERERSQLKFL